jgi:hypothetical protein
MIGGSRLKYVSSCVFYTATSHTSQLPQYITVAMNLAYQRRPVVVSHVFDSRKIPAVRLTVDYRVKTDVI